MLLRITLLLIGGSLCLAILNSPTEQDVAPSGTFNVLSISIDGCKWSDDLTSIENTKGITYIGKMISEFNYSVIHVQGDLNLASHNALYNSDHHSFRTTISEDRWHQNGLDTLSDYSWADFTRIKWEWWEDQAKATKGFTFMRVRVEEGVYIDMINLHTEIAAASPADSIARLWNIQQIASFIDSHSAGNAVIVFGNTNSLYTGVKDNIYLLTAHNGLTDAWVQAIGGTAPRSGGNSLQCPKGVPPDISCEAMDKVFYRGSPIINLNSSGFFYDTSRFLSPKGDTLADRNPVRVEFKYTLESELRQSDLYGGPHGTWFNDLSSIPSSPKLSSITLRGGNRLDGIALTLTSGQTFTHGGWGGDPYSLTLASGEYLISVKLCWDKKREHTRNFFAEATTNKGRSVRAGNMTNNCATATAPSGYGVVGTYGQAGDEMDQLGFIYAKK